MQLARFHSSSHHLLQTYPGGLDAFKKKHPSFIMDTWLPEGTAELKDRSDREINFGGDLITKVVERYYPDKVRICVRYLFIVP